jgi:hypothetical protein
MYHRKLNAEESLQEILLRMKYDSSKTLNENIGIIKEETEDEKIANEIWSGAYNGGSGTNEKKIVSGIKKIKDANQFASVDALLKKLSGSDITQTINGEFGSDDASYATSIATYLNKIGVSANSGVTSKIVGMAATPQDNFNGKFSISKAAAPKSAPASTADTAVGAVAKGITAGLDATKKAIETGVAKNKQTTVTNPSTPDGLDVKKFQDWLDKNKGDWAWSKRQQKNYKVESNPNRGYGRFGPSTQKMWNDPKIKDEYLKSSQGTDKNNQQQSWESDNVRAYGMTPDEYISTY